MVIFKTFPGTISKWYFARDKSKLNSPIKTTFKHLIRFHLGSVCLGAIILTIVRLLVRAIQRLRERANESQSLQFILVCLQWIVEQLERVLQYIVRNAYIFVAKDGTPLIESGKKAVGLLMRNILDVMALNTFGDTILAFAGFFIVLISMFIGYFLMVRI